MVHAKFLKVDTQMPDDQFIYWLGQVPNWIAASPSTPFELLANRFYLRGWCHNPCAPERFDAETGYYYYPGDPVLKPFGKIIRNAADGTVFETIYAYPHELWLFVRPDGHYEMARMN